MLNIIWILFFFTSAFAALYQFIILGNAAVFNGIMESTFSMAKTAFEISLGLTGVMTFWLGMMKIAENAGMIRVLTRLVSPIMVKLFPSVPKDHPAMGAMMLNLSANMLGLDNAATPLGIKAMEELQTLNKSENKETATDAQIMFLVINASSVTIIPITIFTYLYQVGYKNPTELFIPILIATTASTTSGIIATAIYQRMNLIKSGLMAFILGLLIAIIALIAMVAAIPKDRLTDYSTIFSNFFIFGTILLFIIYGTVKKINIYETFIAGAKEGFKVSITIIPYLVAMLVAIGVFRASGALDVLLSILRSFFELCAVLLSSLGLINYTPGTEMEFIKALPTALMKPFSGSGARGLMLDTIKANGVDSIVSKMVASIQGSTETTFYTIAVYYGAVGVKRARFTPIGGLIADFFGITVAIIVTYIFFG